MVSTIYNLSIVPAALFPPGMSPQGDGHGRRASTSPYPNTPSLLAQPLHLHQQLYHACTLSPYPSILQMGTKWANMSLNSFCQDIKLCMCTNNEGHTHIQVDRFFINWWGGSALLVLQPHLCQCLNVLWPSQSPGHASGWACLNHLCLGLLHVQHLTGKGCGT